MAFKMKGSSMAPTGYKYKDPSPKQISDWADKGLYYNEQTSKTDSNKAGETTYRFTK